MAGADLIFRIFARDNGASRAFKNLSKAAEDTSEKILGMRKSTLALAAVQAAPLAAPMITSMLALSGAMAEGVAGIAVMKVGLVGMGDAFKAVGARDMKAFDEAMAKLPPQAAGFVREFQKIAPQLTAIRKATQTQMFGPLELTINRLATSYVPMLNKQLPMLGRNVGLVGLGFSQWAVTEPVLGSVQKIIAHTGGDMLILGRVAQNAAQAFLGLASTALPFTTRLAQAVERGTTGWRDWVTAAQKSGRLESMFGRTSETMDQLGHTVTILAKVIGELFANPNTVQAANNLIGVLNLALRVVEGLTNAFSHLPDGMQVAVLSLAGMYLVLRQVSSAFTMLTLVGARAIGSLTVGMVGLSRAVKAGHIAQSMVTMSSKIGTAAGVIGGLTYGLYLLNENAVKPTEHSVSKLSESLVELARTSKVSGEATRVIGQNMIVVIDLMNKVKAADRYNSSRNGIIKSIESLGGDQHHHDHAQAINQLAQNFKELDQALAGLMQNGQANDAAAAFARLGDTWQASGRSLGDLRSKLPEFTAAQQGAAAAALGAGKGFGVMSEKTRVMAEGLAEAVREGRKLTDVFTLLNGGLVAFDHAQLAASEAVIALKEAFSQNGHALDGNTLKAQRNRVAIEDATTATVEAMQAKLDETGSIEQAQAVWAQGTASIRAQARAAGFSKAQMAALNEVIGQMPQVQATRISTPGAAQSISQVGTLDGQIKALKAKLVKVDVIGPVAATSAVGKLREQIARLETKRISIITDFQYKGRNSGLGFGVGGVATGGLIRKFASGGFNGRVLGPGTGTSDSVPAMLSNGEYVVKASSVKTVGTGAMDALNRTGRMPAAAGGSVTPAHVYIHLTGDDPDLLKRVRKMVRLEGGGNVQLAFGR